jgi:hypothetical protein
MIKMTDETLVAVIDGKSYYRDDFRDWPPGKSICFLIERRANELMRDNKGVIRNQLGISLSEDMYEMLKEFMMDDRLLYAYKVLEIAGPPKTIGLSVP